MTQRLWDSWGKIIILPLITNYDMTTPKWHRRSEKALWNISCYHFPSEQPIIPTKTEINTLGIATWWKIVQGNGPSTTKGLLSQSFGMSFSSRLLPILFFDITCNNTVATFLIKKKVLRDWRTPNERLQRSISAKQNAPTSSQRSEVIFQGFYKCAWCCNAIYRFLTKEAANCVMIKKAPQPCPPPTFSSPYEVPPVTEAISHNWVINTNHLGQHRLPRTVSTK